MLDEGSSLGRDAIYGENDKEAPAQANTITFNGEEKKLESGNHGEKQLPHVLSKEEIVEIEEAGEVVPLAESSILNQLCLIAAFAVLGVYCRILLTNATPAGFVNYLSSQFIGSFVLGFVFTTKGDMNLDLFAGISIGFCGSLTTFSTWQVDIVEMLVGAPGSPSDAAGKTYVWFQDQCIGFSVPFAGLAFGKHTADVMAPSLRPALSRMIKFVRKEQVKHVVTSFSLVVCAGAIAGVISVCVLWPGITSFSLIFAPAGAILRFFLSRYLNTLTLNFYWGTFTANIIGSVVAGILFGVSSRNVYSSLGCDSLWGLEYGFCGSLTTISTFVNEIHTLPNVKHAYIYGVMSVLSAQILLIIIMGSFIWTQSEPFSNPSACYFTK